MRIKQSVAIITVAISLGLSIGCVGPSSIAFKKSDRELVKSIQIEKNVPKPKELFYRGGAQAWGGVLGGAIGGAIASACSSDAEQMLGFMDKEHIDISDIVFREAEKQLKESHTFKLVDSIPSDAVMAFSVEMYGFNKTHPFGSNMNPVIRVSAKLTRPGGEIVWQECEYVSDFASENDQGQSLDTYKKEPAKLRAALVCAAQVAVKRILATLI